MMYPKDLTGMKFNMLTAVKKCGFKNNNTQWLCRCDCGNTTIVSRGALVGGKTKSCGCLKHREAANRTHGKSKTRLYYVWRNMINRCYDSNVRDYKSYGGRGITICDEWKNDFQVFHDWAIANGYDETAERGKFTLDRIDVQGNYEPANCRWTDEKTQANNKRNNNLIEYNGITKTEKQWSDEKGIPYKTLHNRLHYLHWDVERALNEQPQTGRRKGH